MGRKNVNISLWWAAMLPTLRITAICPSYVRLNELSFFHSNCSPNVNFINVFLRAFFEQKCFSLVTFWRQKALSHEKRAQKTLKKLTLVWWKYTKN